MRILLSLILLPFCGLAQTDSLTHSFIWYEKIDYTNGEKVLYQKPGKEKLYADSKIVSINGKSFAVDSTRYYPREGGDALIVYYCKNYILRYRKESFHGDWAQWINVKTRKLIYQFKSTNSL